MATYMGAFRSNFFRVTDEDELRRIIGNLVSGNGVKLIDNRKPYFAFEGDGGLEGVEDENGFGYAAMIAQLQAIVPEDEAIVIISSGNGKLGYVVGEVTIITKYDCRDYFRIP